MKVHNIRLGFATNSSSSHSIVILADGMRVDDVASDGQDCFGWENFTLASKEEKRRYMAVILKDNFSWLEGRDSYADDSSDATLERVQEWTGVRLNSEAYIDHQSSQFLPKNWEGNELHREFFDEYLAYVLRDNMAILGGSDCGDHPLKYDNPTKVTEWEMGDHHCPNAYTVARKDGKVWVLFARNNGNKVRFSFE